MLMDKLGKLSDGSKRMISLMTIILVAMGMYNWAVSPQKSYLKAAQRYDNMMANAGEKSLSIKKGIQVKEKELAIIRQEISATRGSFFNEKTSREFFSDIEPMSHQSNCVIESLNFMPAITTPANEAGDDSEVILKSAEIVFSGKYENIIQFLRKLNSYSQRITISDIAIESMVSSRKNLICRMAIAIYLVDHKETVAHE